MAGSRVKDNHVRLASLETLAAAAFFCPVFHLPESSSLFLYVIREEFLEIRVQANSRGLLLGEKRTRE